MKCDLFGFCIKHFLKTVFNICQGHSFFGKTEQVNNFQDSDCVKNQYGNEPISLIIFGSSPGRYTFPNKRPQK